MFANFFKQVIRRKVQLCDLLMKCLVARRMIDALEQEVQEKADQRTHEIVAWMLQLECEQECVVRRRYEVQVAKGRALLDSALPGWTSNITRKPVMEHTGLCVLGQVYGDYLEGFRQLGLIKEGEEITLAHVNIGVQHGFCVEPPEKNSEEYRAALVQLADEWLLQIGKI